MREMKDRGIPWIGEIPKDWTIELIGNQVKEVNNPNTEGLEDNALQFKMGTIISKSRGDSKYNPETLEGYNIVDKGVIMLNGLNLSFDLISQRVGLVRERGVITSTYLAVKPTKNIDSEYLTYLFKAYDNCKAFHSMGRGLRQTLSYGELRKYLLLYPSLAEQQRIAEFLDRKCAEVDEMIGLQEQIIEELKAYKQSVITEAVTKGLNPDAPMRDSGIEWIGQIPEHWEVTKLKRIVKVSDGTHDTPEYIDKDRNSYPLVTSRCIVDGEIDISLAHHISEQDYIEISKRSAVSKYDVIMPMIGTVGNPAILMTDDKIAIKNVALFRTYGDLDKAKYIKYYLNSLLVKEQFNFTFRGGVQNFVSQDIIKNLLFLMPEDYREVVNLLDTKCTEIDNLISIKQSKIDSLKEYKKSIIYEYVTGKKEVK